MPAPTGYHRQNVVIKDMNGGSSTYSTFVGIDRAFVSSLERAYVREISGTGYADVRNTFLQRLEIAFGKPGDANSLDTLLHRTSTKICRHCPSVRKTMQRALRPSVPLRIVRSRSTV